MHIQYTLSLGSWPQETEPGDTKERQYYKMSFISLGRKSQREEIRSQSSQLLDMKETRRVEAELRESQVLAVLEEFTLMDNYDNYQNYESPSVPVRGNLGKRLKKIKIHNK